MWRLFEFCVRITVTGTKNVKCPQVKLLNSLFAQIFASGHGLALNLTFASGKF